jgi:hypothetical protein
MCIYLGFRKLNKQHDFQSQIVLGVLRSKVLVLVIVVVFNPSTNT